ncbi:alginate O-acetyltransferase AlgX-related protein [Pararoseomonas indoligenes]|uniref:Cell division protein FtsQ n=1 Tax=Roseomonas indoligenes TaxID=2820811 RepID=A0A940MZ14_9PROT|nr:cell division protein FtsQ [Pararoseomonas indoligenes]MBP0494781.1 cell division protein FtsQ [Pararoseomonas indoligenes]
MTETSWKGAHAAAVFQGAAAAVLLALAAWQGIAAIASEPGQERLRPTLNLGSFLSGKLTGAVNHVMAHELPADPLLRASGGVFRYDLFRSGGPLVRVGCDDTLFLTEELRPWPGAEAAMAERAAIVRRVRDGLAQRGVLLSVALVPDKARVKRDRLCGAPRSEQATARYDAFAEALRGQGIQPLLLLRPLAAREAQGGAWWRTDTHWSQEGARAAAAAIAAALRVYPLSRSTTFRTTSAAEETNGPGDLLRLMSLDRVPDALRPAPDRQRLEHTEAAEAGSGGGGLLDETPAPEVALVGSSYSVNANFHGALQELLRTAVVNAAKAGGGFAGSANEYFAGQAFRETPPRIVVWEIPERVVGQPLGQGERDLAARW